MFFIWWTVSEIIICPMMPWGKGSIKQIYYCSNLVHKLDATPEYIFILEYSLHNTKCVTVRSIDAIRAFLCLNHVVRCMHTNLIAFKDVGFIRVHLMIWLWTWKHDMDEFCISAPPIVIIRFLRLRNSHSVKQWGCIMKGLDADRG